MQKQILEIVNRKIKHWTKVDKVRSILIENTDIDYNDASVEANRIIKDIEGYKIACDNKYMQEHFKSLNVERLDSEQIFWQTIGVKTEDEIHCLLEGC